MKWNWWRSRKRCLPALDDELAKKFGAENLEKLKAGVRRIWKTS